MLRQNTTATVSELFVSLELNPQIRQSINIPYTISNPIGDLEIVKMSADFIV